MACAHKINPKVNFYPRFFRLRENQDRDRRKKATGKKKKLKVNNCILVVTPACAPLHQQMGRTQTTIPLVCLTPPCQPPSANHTFPNVPSRQSPVPPPSPAVYHPVTKLTSFLTDPFSISMRSGMSQQACTWCYHRDSEPSLIAFSALRVVRDPKCLGNSLIPTLLSVLPQSH